LISKSEYLTEAEIAALFRVIKSPRDLAIFTVMYGRALRCAEVEILQLSDWNDRDGQQLQVRRLKNSISQVYRLSPAEAKALRAWLRIRGLAPGPLFPSRKSRAGGLGINRTQCFRLFQKYCRAAGIPAFKSHPHAMRHAAAMTLRAGGGSAEAIGERLGHRSKRSASRYLRRSR
jgi:integrase